jgi:hypothetical protein
MSFADAADLEFKARTLEGRTIGQVASPKNLAILHEQWRQVQAGERKYMEKQVINDIIEQDFFSVPKNSSEDPDITLDNGDMFELKVSHLFKSRDLVRPKYRLVLKVLNYLDMAKHENWQDSALYKKLKQMVIVFYYKDEDRPPWDWIVTNSFLWFSANYNDEIQSDYTLTRNAVLTGQKISESDTKLLANCPKHNSKFCWWCHVGDECNNPKKRHPAPHPVLDGALRPHPALGSAEKRGYCIPAQRMAVVFSDEIGIDLERSGGGNRASYGVPMEKIAILQR